tara:strand:- start:56021 stop:56476 length:456 start_codon:yes stop_codon:yes gene_type:complete
MKLIFIIFSLFINVNICNQSANIDEVRSVFLSCEGNIVSIQKLIDLTKNELVNETIIVYNSTANLMILDFMYNPLKKYLSFNKYTKVIDSIIEMNPSNIEIRLLRYIIQKKSPEILSYNKNIFSDSLYVVKNMKGLEQNFLSYLKILIKSF